MSMSRDYKRGAFWVGITKEDKKLVKALMTCPEYLPSVRREYWRRKKEQIAEGRRRRYKSQDPLKKIEHNAKRKLQPNYRAQRRVAKASRRARKAAVMIQPITAKFWAQALVDWDGRCAYCGAESEVLEMDHFVPLARGGAHAPHNVVPACKGCNSSKGPRDPFEFLSGLRN